MNRFYMVGFLAAALVACGDDTGTGGAGASGGSAADGGSGGAGGTHEGGGGGALTAWESYCEERSAACDGFDAALCKTQETCAKGLLRDEIEESLFACLTTECADDTCFGATMTTPLTDQGESFLASCMTWTDNCPDALDDICADAYVLTDATLSALEDCTLAPTCGDADTCMAPILATLDDCEGWL